jgi:hypothetical protein
MRHKWKLVSVCLEIVLIVTQYRCVVCAERTIRLKLFSTHPMQLLGCVLVECRFGPFGDSVSVGAREVHSMRQTYHRLRNHFGRTRWYA